MTTILDAEIEGKKYPVRFDALHFEEVESLIGKSYFDAIQNPSARLYNALAYVGLKCGAKFKNQKFEKSYEEVAQWIHMSEMKQFFTMALRFTVSDDKLKDTDHKKEESTDQPGE